MDCSSGTVAFVLVAGAVIFALSAFLRSKELKKTSDGYALELDRLRGLVAGLEKRLSGLEAWQKTAAAAPPPPLEAVADPAEQIETMKLTVPFPAAPLDVRMPAGPPPIPISIPEEPAPVPIPVNPDPPTVEIPVPPPPRVSLEEKLGARLPVWIGSIALALAGAFLVKLSFDRGWLAPPVRVAMGVLFGVGLLAAGEVTRRNRAMARVSQGLSAAGVADLFACFLAGIHLYNIIPKPLGFGLMVVTTAVAVGLSLRQGKMVALIGLIGGFATPYLVRTGEPNVRGLFAYLLLLQIGLLTVAWKRGWTEIAGLALGGGLLWTFLWTAGPFAPGDSVWLGAFLLLSVASVVVAGLTRRRLPGPADSPDLLPLIWLAAPGALLALAMVAQRSGFSTTEWVYFGLLSAGLMVLARLRPDLHPLAWVAAGASAVLLSAWSLELTPEPGRYLGTAAALGALFAGGGYIALWGTEKPGRWASLSAASGLIFFLIAYGTVSQLREEMRWGPWALATAALYLAAAVPLAQKRRARPELDPALAAVAVAVTSFLSLAVPLELERQWLTVAWALEVTALVWLAGRFKLPVLSALARVLTLIVAVRLLANFSVLEYPLGTDPLFNWLLYGYGLPLAAFATAAWLARRQGPGEAQFATALEAGALAFAFVLVTLEVRQLYHPGTPGSGAPSLAEAASLASAWAALGLGLLVANRRALLASVEMGGRILIALAAGWALALPCVLLNPLWDHQAVGETPVFNLLLWIYAVPAVLLGIATAELRRRGSRKLPVALITAVLILSFVLLTLEVRQAFHGSWLDRGASTVAERYSYSAAWILFGAALLVLGVMRRGKALRYASLAVMLLAVGKVFLYDMSNLSDLYRVFSFLGLGVSLLALAWVYQRFVFREMP
jgi:uncharacterized membrane protein